MLSVLLLLALQLPPAGSAGPMDAFLDASARELILAARSRREAVDRSLVSYTATVRERLATGIRTFRKDRTVYRMEGASRVRWSRDEPIVVQVLAGREEHPRGVTAPDGLHGLSGEFFDPEEDPIYFGLTDSDDDEIWIEHPLAEGSERHYRYRTGDTLTLSFPDGRRLEVVEVEVLPRERSIRLIAGSLWIEPESGGLVRAAFRLSRTIDVERDLELLTDGDDDAAEGMEHVPGFLRPMEIELRMVVVEYALWNFRYWLPRTLRAEGEARAGLIRAPASFEVSYQIEDAYGEEEEEERSAAGTLSSAWDVLDEWDAGGDFRLRTGRSNGRRFRALIPEPDVLLESPNLPPPIWEEMGASISEAELEALWDGLADVPVTSATDAPWIVQWGHRGPDLLRYNRIEGLSVGVRVKRDLGILQGAATLRVGLADPTPDLAAEVTRDRASGRLTLRGYHSLATVDDRGQALGLGNSVNALFLGRDYGEYYRAAGASLTFRPPTTERPWYLVGLYAERQSPVSVHTDAAIPRLWNRNVFRPNIEAQRADQVGAVVRSTPWWGADRGGLQGGLDGFVEGAGGGFDYVRASLAASSVVPLGARLRGGLEVAAGTSWGDVPVQRHWYVGGSSSLRGYPGSTLSGTSFLRGRAEVSRGIQAVGLAVFSDWAWAGSRSDFRTADGLLSVGAGLTTLDGLVRVDLVRALRAPRSWRIEIYLDSLL